ncbi:hypothetical protein EGW08_023111 [Elysia chlorotica]|uniref:AB hydrolase-1 domain-containing protein n=1 Tax=Elysia chlorotica TaxID=188477 RepID=A0A433SJA1_ELYCH|nr:hypothetical protein EGW08_023111 [Elysia chlorotica]
MALRFLTRCLYLLVLAYISSFLTVLTLMRLSFLVLTKGPKKMFSRASRDTEPPALTDAKYGVHGYLHLEDVRIHYVSRGSPDKPLMLMLHGFPESWYSWRYQIQEFSQTHRVVAVDLRGYGDSDKPSQISEYKMERLVKDVKQIITALGYSSCVLVGHDWGGAITWTFAGCYPHMVDKAVVLNCPHPLGFRKYMMTHWAQFKKSWYMFFFLMPILPEIYIGLSDLKFFDIIFLGKKGGVLSGATTKADVEVYKYLFQTWHSLTGPINYIRAGLVYRLPSRLAQKVTCPVLLLWGRRDLALEAGQAEAARDFAYDLTVQYLDTSSHWVQMDEPDTVNAHIRDFLSA